MSEDNIREGWVMMQPSYHKWPYSVEYMMGGWHLRQHHGNGASSTVSVHPDQFDAMDSIAATRDARND